MGASIRGPIARNADGLRRLGTKSSQVARGAPSRIKCSRIGLFRFQPVASGASSDDWLALAHLIVCRVGEGSGKDMDDRAFASATELSTEIGDRRVGCVELFDFYLARAKRHNPALNAIVVWQLERARERARAADARSRGVSARDRCTAFR
jgi:hypothetical protein